MSGGQPFTELTFSGALSQPAFLITLILIFALLLFISQAVRSKQVTPAALLAFSVLYGGTLAFYNADNIYFNIGIAFVLFLIVAWVMKGDKIGLQNIRLSKNPFGFSRAWARPLLRQSWPRFVSRAIRHM